MGAMKTVLHDATVAVAAAFGVEDDDVREYAAIQADLMAGVTVVEGADGFTVWVEVYTPAELVEVLAPYGGDLAAMLDEYDARVVAGFTAPWFTGAAVPA